MLLLIKQKFTQIHFYIDFHLQLVTWNQWKFILAAVMHSQSRKKGLLNSVSSFPKKQKNGSSYIAYCTNLTRVSISVFLYTSSSSDSCLSSVLQWKWNILYIPDSQLPPPGLLPWPLCSFTQLYETASSTLLYPQHIWFNSALTHLGIHLHRV